MFVQTIASPQFVEYLYRVFISKIRENLNNVRGNLMNDYLKNNYAVSLDKVVSQVANYYTYAISNDMYDLVPGGNNKEEKTGEKLSTLIRLIDKGNASIKGTNAFTDAERYLKDKAREIYLSYVYRKEKGHGS